MKLMKLSILFMRFRYLVQVQELEVLDFQFSL